MIKTLLKLLVAVVLMILIYNYFFGDAQEKETSRQIFGEVKQLGASIGSLLSTEKEKYDEGKYENALQKIGDVFKSIKQHLNAGEHDRDLDLRLSQLEDKRKELEQEAAKVDGTDSVRVWKLKREIGKLVSETQELAEEIQ